MISKVIYKVICEMIAPPIFRRFQCLKSKFQMAKFQIMNCPTSVRAIPLKKIKGGVWALCGPQLMGPQIMCTGPRVQDRAFNSVAIMMWAQKLSLHSILRQQYLSILLHCVCFAICIISFHNNNMNFLWRTVFKLCYGFAFYHCWI